MHENEARETILQIGFSWAVPRALYVAAELGLADSLAAGPRSAAEIATEVEADLPSLERLLRLLVKHGILDRDDDGRLRLNGISQLMRSDTPGSLRDFLRMDSETMWGAYGALLHTVRTGEPGFDHVQGKNFFQYLTSDMEGAMRVDAAQRSLSVGEERILAQILDPSGAQTVVDLGGGRGGLLTEILQRHEAVRGILGDQPQVVENPERLREAGLLDRCEAKPVDFFDLDSVPKGHDLYLLKRVIHDWDDEKSLVILENVRQAMADEGRLLVIEGIVQEGETDSMVPECDIAIMSFLHGRIRTKSDFERLFAAAGFDWVGTLPATSLVSIMELRKA